MRNSDVDFWAGVVVLGAVLLVSLIYNLIYAGSGHEMTCKVNSLDRVATSDGSSDARIYTENCGVLQNVDKWVIGKTDSADVQAKITAGKTYKFDVYGWRFGLFSMFPNVNNPEEVK